jgi:hypothetical protein
MQYVYLIALDCRRGLRLAFAVAMAREQFPLQYRVMISTSNPNPDSATGAGRLKGEGCANLGIFPGNLRQNGLKIKRNS